MSKRCRSEAVEWKPPWAYLFHTVEIPTEHDSRLPVALALRCGVDNMEFMADSITNILVT